MDSRALDPRLVHRTARIRLQVTRHQPTAAMGCCARPVTSGRGCWTPTGSGSSMGCRRSSAIRRCAANSPHEDPPESCRRSGPARSWAATRMPGSRPPNAAAEGSRPGSHVASAGSSRFAATTARSCSGKDGCGCRSPRAIPCCGCGWPAPFPIPSSKSERSRCSPMGGGGCEAGTQARAEGVTALAPSPAPRAA